MIMEQQQMLSITDFGAIGDGETDNTTAIQAALDAAAQNGGGGVWVPAGRYATGMLRMPAYVGLFAAPTWSYHSNGGTELLLNDEDAPCLLDLTHAFGARIHGLGLSGQKLGDNIHGIFMDIKERNQEDTIFIEHCRITAFTGDGISFKRAWGFTIRNNMVIFNQGNALTFMRFDGWVQDNIFNNNGGWGIYARPWNGALTITGNRIEWNIKGGIRASYGSSFQINNNFIDRSGGPGIQFDGGEPEDRPYGRPKANCITGNILHRSGARSEHGSLDSCHLWLEYQQGMTVTGNTFNIGTNDNGAGRVSPSFGIVYSELQNSIIAHNTWSNGVLQEFLVDNGGNGEDVVICDNLGSVAPIPAN